MNLTEYTSITPAEASRYCEGSERQRVRDVIAERVGARKILDYGCGPGIDAARYTPEQYTGFDVSPALISEAKWRWPKHRFACRELPLDWPSDVFLPSQRASTLFDVVVIKSVLEHTPDLSAAINLLRDAMRVARETVYVAWHTPPAREEQLRQVMGHFGKRVHQNTYEAGKFVFALPRDVEIIDGFELWTIPIL